MVMSAHQVRSSEWRFPVQALDQLGTVLYVTSLPIGELIDHCRVDRWREEDGRQKGYQRDLETRRVKAVARYLSRPGPKLLPGAVLLNIREVDLDEVRYEEGSTAGIGTLTIPDHVALYIVDGQHRVYGTKSAIEDDGQHHLRDLPVPVVIISGLTLEEEAEQFRVINETMKKMRTDLARRLLARQVREIGRQGLVKMGRLWEADGAEIIEFLNAAEDSPWKGRIQPPNVRKTREHTVRELSFSTSLKPILTKSVLKSRKPEVVAKVMLEYWKAWREVVPGAFERPADYVMMKTPGVFSLHLFAEFLLDICREIGLVPVHLTAAEFGKLISELPDEYLDPSYWENGNVRSGAAAYGSMKGFAALADILKAEFEESFDHETWQSGALHNSGGGEDQ